MVFPVGLALALSSLRPDTSINLLELVNQYRQGHGLAKVELDSSLCRVASGHALFMDANQVLSHEERKDMKQFFGEDLAARAATIRWQDDLSELVGFARSGTADAVQAIFDSPCHRIRFLKPGKLKLGASVSGDFVCLLIGGSAESMSVVSPPDGAEDVSPNWSSRPDLSGTSTGMGSIEFGYPITYTDPRLPANSRLWQITLQDPEGKAVPGKPIGGGDCRFPHSLVFVPSEPLAVGAKYSAEVRFTCSNGKEVVRVWGFQTGKGR